MKRRGQNNQRSRKGTVQGYLAGKSERDLERLIGRRGKRRFAGHRRGKPLPGSHLWQKWELDLLGKLPDREVARLSGRPLTAVRRARGRRGIASATPMRVWTRQEERLLGRMPDAEVARRLKRGSWGVKFRRQLLGISKHWVKGCSEAQLKRWLGPEGLQALARRRQSKRRFIKARWQRWEDKLLPKISPLVASRIIRRTMFAIERRMKKLAIKRRRFLTRWTGAEKRLLGTM